jgi:hypothetical protein
MYKSISNIVDFVQGAGLLNELAKGLYKRLQWRTRGGGVWGGYRNSCGSCLSWPKTNNFPRACLCQDADPTTWTSSRSSSASLQA